MTSRKRSKNRRDGGTGVYMREWTTSRVTGADRPYGKFYDFYRVSLETFGSTLVYSTELEIRLSFGKASEWGGGGLNPSNPPSVRHWIQCRMGFHKTYINIKILLKLWIILPVIQWQKNAAVYQLYLQFQFRSSQYFYYITKRLPGGSTWLSFLTFCKLSLPFCMN
jgi:hypothetical protein